eukprot:Lithocolla_globosa_v1_NODE_3913_length_1552_cov_2.533734.p1 type:complete len:241 gc:universal NODE_3913_length_1552_cov_2.533734:755-33(-)
MPVTRSQRKKTCPFGADCYRTKNPDHTAEYHHETDKKSLGEKKNQAKKHGSDTDGSLSESSGTDVEEEEERSSKTESPTVSKGTLTVKRGDLVTDATEDLVVHQVNATSKGHCEGLAKVLFAKYPDTDVYKQRVVTDKPGNVHVIGRVVSLVGQHYPGGPKPSKGDNSMQRERWFVQCLKGLAQHVERHRVESIAFPHQIGCGIAGGDWDFYERQITKFQTITGIDVVIYRRPGGRGIIL